MSETNLYGRESFVKDIIADLIDQKPPVVFVSGFSGMGKTSILQPITDELEQTHGYKVCQYTVQSSLQSYEEPFLLLLKEILKSIPDNDITPKEILDAVIRHPENRLARLLSSAGQDLAKKCGLENTLKAVGEIFIESVDSLIAEAKKIAYEDRESFYTEYTDALTSIAPLCHSQYLLIIDQLEKAPEPLITFLSSSFSKNKPKCVDLLLAINDEREEGIERLKLLKPDYQYIGVQPIRLDGITSSDLKEWIHIEKNVELPDEVLEKAITELDGRPLFLRSWIDYGDYSLESLSFPETKTYGFYDKLFSRLDSSHQKVAIILAHLPSSLPVDIDLVSDLCSISSLDINIILTNLESYNFIEKEGPFSRISHQLVRNFIINKSSLSHSQKMDVLRIIEKHFGNITVAESAPNLLEAKLALTTSIENTSDFQFYLSIAKRQLDEEAYRSAIQIAEIALENSSGVSVENESLIGMLLIKCESLEKIGEYSNALSILSERDLDAMPARVKANGLILLAKLYLRLNRYKDSLDVIDRGEIILLSLGDSEGLAELYFVKGHVLRDTEQYEQAYDLANNLSKDVLPRVSNELIRAHIFRSTSRAKGSLFMSEAIVDATQAKEIALKNKSKGHIGNAEFTLGEAYRLNRQFAEAQDAYISGLDIAISLGNRDLEIYCKLGLTATMLCNSDLDSKHLFIADLAKLNSDDFPVESLHSKMLTYVEQMLRNEEVCLAEIEEIDEAYRSRYSRSIPGAYLIGLQSLSEVEQRVKYVKDNPIRL